MADNDGWKNAFDSDPAGRKKSGVRQHHVMRPVNTPNYVMMDLTLDTAKEAEALIALVRANRGQVEGTITSNPKARIVEVAETVTL